MTLNSVNALIKRLTRGKAERERFVESHLAKGIAHQIRAIRDNLRWSQEELAQKIGMTQNAISRLESAEYGRPTITTLKRLASAFDTGLIVRFAPFSEMVCWISGTPLTVQGLSRASLAVPSFAEDEGLTETKDRTINSQDSTGAMPAILEPLESADRVVLRVLRNPESTFQARFAFSRPHAALMPISNINETQHGSTNDAWRQTIDNRIANAR
jgi:transcriptional regulator with XRE-family HTH domain